MLFGAIGIAREDRKGRAIWFARNFQFFNAPVGLFLTIDRGARVTTVFPRQGHYATDPEALRTFPAADLAIDRIAALLTVDHSTLFPAAGPR